MGGRMDGRTDGQTDGQTDGCMDGGWVVCRLMDGWMGVDGWICCMSSVVPPPSNGVLGGAL